MKEATKPLTIRISARDDVHLKRVARLWRLTPREAAQKLIRMHAALNELHRMEPMRRRIAKKLGVKTEEDVYRLFGE